MMSWMEIFQASSWPRESKTKNAISVSLLCLQSPQTAVTIKLSCYIRQFGLSDRDDFIPPEHMLYKTCLTIEPDCSVYYLHKLLYTRPPKS